MQMRCRLQKTFFQQDIAVFGSRRNETFVLDEASNQSYWLKTYQSEDPTVGTSVRKINGDQAVSDTRFDIRI
jgi:hypothetical protein